MRTIMKNVADGLSRIWRDEQGAEGLEKLLILSLLVLPLLVTLIFFGKDIKEWVIGKWEDVKDETDDLITQ